MEFNIRKGATLPYIEVDLIKDGRTDYNYTQTIDSVTNSFGPNTYQCGYKSDNTRITNPRKCS